MNLFNCDRKTRLRLTCSAGVFALCVLVASLLAAPAFSYVPMFTRMANGGTQASHWDFGDFPVNWTINTEINDQIRGNRSATSVIATAFNTWTSAPNAAIQIGTGGETADTTEGFDGMNLVCFICQGDFASHEETLAVTITTISDRPGEDTKHGTTSTFAGQIIDSDILFNPSVLFTTGGSDGQDLETIAVHEIGHFLGLDHSGVVRAIMFPFAPDVLKTLSYDDVAGLFVLYPKVTPDVAIGTISGSVRFPSGGAVFGAHVYADSNSAALPFGLSIRKSPVGTVTRPDGSYSIQGVPVDTYIVTAEPLDLPMTNRNIEGYASAFSKASVQTGFNTRWH